MDVANLHTVHALKSSRQIGNCNFDPMYLIVQPLGRKTIHSGKKRTSPGERGGRFEKITARGIGDEFRGGWRRGVRRSAYRRRSSLRGRWIGLEMIRGT